MPLRAYAPNGHEIIGTLESLQGCALADVSKDPVTGAVRIDYAGETKLYWDTQETVGDAAGQTLYLDELGNEVPENQLLWRHAPATAE